MRTLPVRFSSESRRDLHRILRFLQANGASEAVTRDYVRRLMHRCEKIGLSPEGYALREDIGPGIRLVPFGRSARVTYQVADDVILIINVYYGGQDIYAASAPPAS